MWLLEVRLFFIATQFLTRIPIPPWVGFDPSWLHASARYFPLVGAGVGLWGAFVYLVLHMIWGPWIAALGSVAATIWLTGAFHEDGWADTCDALGGFVSREKALEIMKDSRIGTYGAVGLVLMIGLKTASLASLAPLTASLALVVAHTLSRAVAVSLIRFLPYAGDPEHTKAKPLASQVSGPSWGVACGWALAVVAVVGIVWPQGWGLLCTSLGVCLWVGGVCARWFMRRLGGVTGDTLGASQQLSELAVLLTWFAFARQFGLEF